MEEVKELDENTKAESEAQSDFKYYVSIRFKNTKKAYSFGCDESMAIKYGDDVVVETARGMELGKVISDVREIIAPLPIPLKPILRVATRKDIEDAAENEELAKEALVKCQECVSRLKLEMNLISSEYTLDRAKIIFVYVADERVDFRELLKELASIFKCRIELRQIGPRDKAKIVGGIGPCGNETCCSRFLSDFDVVSINMAKNQLLALNIQKLSGQCGKLMCCLKYEDDLYKELKEGLPKMNSQVEYEGKIYRITSMNVINRIVKLENKETSLFLGFDEAIANGLKKVEHNNNQNNRNKENKKENNPQKKEKNRNDQTEKL